MSPTGPRFPTAAASGSGAFGAWTTPTNAEVEDGVFTSGNISGGGSQTNYLQTTAYGFTLPSTAIIDGIMIEFKRYGATVNTLSVAAMKAGAVAGTAKTTLLTDIWPSTSGAAAYVAYGGPTDLWGTNWLYSDINNSGFGAAVSAMNSHGGGSAFIDAVRVTVYWHTAPTLVPKRYEYKVYSNGQFLGLLPDVVSEFGYSQDINTAGVQITVECAISADTSFMPVDVLTDESGNILTDENSVTLTDEGQIPIVALGGDLTNALIKNGNDVEVWEYSYYYPNGLCVLLGEMNRWEASFGGSGGGSGGAATSDTGSDSISILIYSDGQDMSNYLVRGNPYTLTPDVSQTSENNFTVIEATSFAGPVGGADNWTYVGQTWKVGAGIHNLDAIDLQLNGGADVTLSVYTDPTASTLLGSITWPGISTTGNQVLTFGFATPIAVTPGQTLFFAVTVPVNQGIEIFWTSGGVYSGGSMYQSVYGGSGGGNYIAQSGQDLYFTTYSGTGSTLGTYTNEDPTTGMLVPIMEDYNARGGLIQFTTSSIMATGLSLTYQFQTNTVFEALQAMLTLAPDGFYWYVDMGTDTLYFKQANTVADIVLTKGRHMDQITIIATIEKIINTAFFTGGLDPTSGPPETSIYVAYSDANSIGLYGPRLDRPSDSNVLDDASATAVAASDVEENSAEQFQTTVTIVDQTMDTNLLKLGMVVGLNGFGTFIDQLTAQIVHIDKTPEEVTLTLGILPVRLATSFEQLTRSLVALQSVDNPDSPTYAT